MKINSLNDNKNAEFDNYVKMNICEILENMIKMHNFKQMVSTLKFY